MSNLLRDILHPSKDHQIKMVQMLLREYEKAEINRSCDTCRNKTTTYHDDRDGDICKCDIRGIESIVNGRPLNETVENCPYWSRDSGVYEFLRETINQEGDG